MKQITTVFLCFLLAISIVTPSVFNIFSETAIEIVDLTDDEDTKEPCIEKEGKDLVVHQTRDLAFVDIEANQSLLTFQNLHQYETYITINVPPPQGLL